MEQPSNQTRGTIIRTVVATVIAILLLLIVIGAVAGNNTAGTEATEESYMGMTRQMYLDQVSNNGQDMGMHCAYSYLIDTYGLEATYRMDRRAGIDDNDIDPAVFEALDRC